MIEVYAQALFYLGEEDNVLEDIYNDFLSIISKSKQGK